MTVDKSLDLRGVRCPLNYVQAKLILEEMPEASCLELLLDAGEPIERVPRSLASDGHTILDQRQDGSSYRVIIRK